MATVIAAFIRGLFRAPLTAGDSSNNGRLEGQALSRYSKHFVGALRSWTAQLGLPVRMAIQVRRRVAFLTRKWILLPRYASTVFIYAADSVYGLAVRTLEHALVRRYPVGWATMAQPVDAQTRAIILTFLSSRGGRGQTFLMIACGRGYVKVVKDILQLIPQHIPASSLEEGDMDGWTALHYAIRGGNEGVVDLLLNSGAQANCQDLVGAAPLMIVAGRGRVDLVRRLLQHLTAPELERRHASGRTALHYAANGGHEEVIDLLLSHGADANTRDHSGLTPLMQASWEGHLGVVQKLLEVVGDKGLEDRDNSRMTALHHAAFAGHENVVAFLLNNGAQANSKDMEARRPS